MRVSTFVVLVVGATCLLACVDATWSEQEITYLRDAYAREQTALGLTTTDKGFGDWLKKKGGQAWGGIKKGHSWAVDKTAEGIAHVDKKYLGGRVLKGASFAEDYMKNNGKVVVHGNFCGPGHMRKDQEPVDLVDACCEQHDICYGKERHNCCCELSLRRCLQHVKRIDGCQYARPHLHAGDWRKEKAIKACRATHQDVYELFSVKPCVCHSATTGYALPRRGVGGCDDRCPAFPPLPQPPKQRDACACSMTASGLYKPGSGNNCRDWDKSGYEWCYVSPACSRQDAISSTVSNRKYIKCSSNGAIKKWYTKTWDSVSRSAQWITAATTDKAKQVFSSNKVHSTSCECVKSSHGVYRGGNDGERCKAWGFASDKWCYVSPGCNQSNVKRGVTGRKYINCTPSVYTRNGPGDEKCAGVSGTCWGDADERCPGRAVVKHCAGPRSRKCCPGA